SGMVTQSASGKGVGGQITRELIGHEALQLKAQREQQASNLTAAAQNLETQRQNILQQLFPRLADVQLANLKGVQSVLNQSNSMMPNAGLSGSDIANIWLARVGATNQLAQSAADAQARAGMGIAQAWGQLGGNLSATVGNSM